MPRTGHGSSQREVRQERMEKGTRERDSQGSMCACQHRRNGLRWPMIEALRCHVGSTMMKALRRCRLFPGLVATAFLYAHTDVRMCADIHECRCAYPQACANQCRHNCGRVLAHVHEGPRARKHKGMHVCADTQTHKCARARLLTSVCTHSRRLMISHA